MHAHIGRKRRCLSYAQNSTRQDAIRFIYEPWHDPADGQVMCKTGGGTLGNLSHPRGDDTSFPPRAGGGEGVLGGTRYPQETTQLLWDVS